jgi:hypothetical protein
MTAAEAPTRKRRRSEGASLRGTSLLQRLLAELAFALLPRGMTPRRFAELARFAFVRAATEMSRLRNGRVNYSRVAAQTGLSRADVKRLLKSDAFDHQVTHAPMERVVNGWRTDRLFAYRPGRPRGLRIAGRSASFASLVRKYGGDVPHRAVLDELRRIHAVTDNGKRVWLKTSPVLRKRHDFTFLSPALPALVDGIRIASRQASSRPSSSIQRLTLPIESEVDLAIARERCHSSIKSMLDGLGESLGTSVRVPQTRRNSAFSFTITVLLAENRATNFSSLGNQHVKKRRTAER